MTPRVPIKQESVHRLCDLLGMPRLPLYRGSSVPVQVFERLMPAVGLPYTGGMPEMAEAVAGLAGLVWDRDQHDSRRTPSGGGSTVTRPGLARLVEATEALLGQTGLVSGAALTAPQSTLVQQIRGQARAADSEGLFDPASAQDEREVVARVVALRRGQPAFRASLLRLYGGHCTITSCDAPDALEAAHITPYRGPQTNHPSNGLLLRADVHTLFDLLLLAFHDVDRRVLLHDRLRGTRYEAELNGALLRPPNDTSFAPSPEALRLHRDSCGL